MINNQFTVDIIIPCFNCHNTLKRTLSSIAMQENYREIRVTLVDDCSSINYDEIAKLFSNLLEIQIVEMKKNGGPGVARQIGYDHTDAPFVMWMDADDTLMSANTILMLKKCMIEKDYNCVYGQFLEEAENGGLLVHETNMVWIFGKLYSRSFLNQFNIRFNSSRENEDTGFNSIVKVCTSHILYIPQPVYIWHFRAGSIARSKMYEYEFGFKGYIDNMIWQIKELGKRFINKNLILNETVSNIINLYYFYEINKIKYPINTYISLNWIRGYYQEAYKDFEPFISDELFKTIFINVTKSQEYLDIVPSITIYDFMEEISKPRTYKSEHELKDATPIGHTPKVVPNDWPVIIKKFNDGEKIYDEYNNSLIEKTNENISEDSNNKNCMSLLLNNECKESATNFEPFISITNISCDSKEVDHCYSKSTLENNATAILVNETLTISNKSSDNKDINLQQMQEKLDQQKEEPKEEFNFDPPIFMPIPSGGSVNNSVREYLAKQIEFRNRKNKK